MNFQIQIEELVDLDQLKRKDNMLVLKGGIDGKQKFSYNPKDDITVCELSSCMEILLSASSKFPIDYEKFIKEFKIERHFEITEDKNEETKND